MNIDDGFKALAFFGGIILLISGAGWIGEGFRNSNTTTAIGGFIAILAGVTIFWLFSKKDIEIKKNILNKEESKYWFYYITFLSLAVIITAIPVGIIIQNRMNITKSQWLILLFIAGLSAVLFWLSF